MNLCTICDKKITGSWCKNCHRFVKTYELSEQIYVNERHDSKNDMGCTYHAEQNTSHPVSKRRETDGLERKKKGKIVVAIIAVYLLFSVVGVLIPVITKMADSLSEGFRGMHEAEDSFSKFPEMILPEYGEEADLSYTERIAVMETLQPVTVDTEDGYEFRYYRPEEIAGVGFSCDEMHFDSTLWEFETWLGAHWTDVYETEEIISEYYNYYYEDEEYTWLYFSSFRDYFASDDFAVRAGYDTATGRLHMIGFVTLTEQEVSPLYYALLTELDEETTWTVADFSEALKEALEKAAEDAMKGEAYATFYTSDVLEIDVQIKGDCYSVAFYPAYP